MKEELIHKLEELTKADFTPEIISRAEDIKTEYLNECERQKESALHAFLNEGGNADNFEARKDPLDSRFSELMHILSDRESKFRKLAAAEVTAKFRAKEDIVNELQSLISRETSISKAFQDFKELQTRWNDIGNVPSREYKNLQSVYHRHVHNFYYNMKMSKDLRELDFKRNLEQRTQLLSKIESLLSMNSVRGMERLISLYRMEWSELGPTAPETIDELRSRYRDLISRVYQKVREYYQSRQKEEQANLEEKKSLLEKAREITSVPCESSKQWQQRTDNITGLFEKWKKTGFGPKKENEKVWEEFRNTLNDFYHSKREYFSGLKKKYKENKEKKIAIIEKTEAIASAAHENFDTSTKEILQLQKDWKEAGQIDQWDENKLWKRFREACDTFFNAKRDRFSERDAEQLKNLEKKEELIQRIEAFQPGGNTEEDVKTLRDFSVEWKSISHVPFKEKERIWEKYKKVLDSKYDAMKLDSSQAHLLKFRNNVEMLSQSEGSGHLIRKEKNFIVEKINKLQATINQYENNLGFFRNTKNTGDLLKEVEQNLNRAKEEMEFLKKKLKVFTNTNG